MFKSPSHLPEAARQRIAESLNADVLTQVIREFEKHAWMLRASLEG